MLAAKDHKTAGPQEPVCHFLVYSLVSVYQLQPQKH